MEVNYLSKIALPLNVHRCTAKAIEAAVEGQQWNKAVQIVEMQEIEIAPEYYQKIADHYGSVGNFQVQEDDQLASFMCLQCHGLLLHSTNNICSNRLNNVSQKCDVSQVLMLHI